MASAPEEFSNIQLFYENETKQRKILNKYIGF